MESTAAVRQVGEVETGEARFTVEREGRTRGRLVLATGAHEMNIGTHGGGSELFWGTFHGMIPRVAVDGETVRVAYRRFHLMNLLMGWWSSAQVSLDASVPWEVSVLGGLSHVNADLSRLTLTGFTLLGGMSEGGLELPAPTGPVAITIRGGVDRVLIKRPAGVPVRVVIRGGASNLVVDNQCFGAIGGRVEVEGAANPAAPGSYLVEILGGARRVSVQARQQ